MEHTQNIKQKINKMVSFLIFVTKMTQKKHWSDDNLKNKHVPSFHSPLILIKQLGEKKKLLN